MQKNQGSYDVLRPRYIKALAPVGSSRAGHPSDSDWFRVEWTVIGEASSMAEAKEKFGGAPVLASRLA